ncbi:MAG: zf-HC2 domain-containing protein [Candidatus Zixiibacteriota bacterium]
MELRHLTDEEIQDYLDGNVPSGNRYVQEHLRKCERCRKALLEYQSLYLGLKKDRGFELPANFPKAVISKLPEEQTVKSRSKYYESLLIILGILVAGFVSLQFINFRPLFNIISGIQMPQFGFVYTFFHSFETLLKALNINNSLIIFAILTILIISVLDYIILHPKQKPISSLI